MKQLAFFLSGALALVGAEASRKFSFGPEALPGAVAVTPDTRYSTERGYGFEPGDKPQVFSVALPESNYLVTIALGPGATTVKSESRRLAFEKADAGTRTFSVNVRNAKVPPPPLNAPGNDHVELNDRELKNGPGGLVYHWDDKLTLEFNGPHPAVSALEIVPAPELPTVFLVGDSTVTDQPREPGASWGQMLPRFLKPSVVVANHAESGETLKSFLTELRFDKVLGQMKRGDYLFIQFGHNDEKQNWPQTYVEAATTYKAYLKTYVAEARRRGATPVLVSSMQRREFDSQGKIRNTHGGYPAAVAEVAREENVAFIDLSAMSIAFYEALGPTKAPLAFSGSGERRDPTHHDNYGAYELAKCVVAGIRANHLELAAQIVDDFAGFDPAHPDDPATFDLAPSAGRTNVAPRGN